jgi:hypothetical protein
LETFREFVVKTAEANTATVEVIQYSHSKEKEKIFKPYLNKYSAKVDDWIEKDYGVILTVKLPLKNKKEFVDNLPKGWQQE